ncbi:MAG: hypothetical protein A2928_03020 [Candidatus Taylorbacteria bacterium RIFCSPLOWO2_01_FULL_45_15b]|uniref:CYTH domain-containing protein n=1 Tax=Candidatus Taylorbacteria bacterium RIFCSPLOWO2_01_FULL_45_15b TaxID=1802319 RepID=A0A1G2NEH5_9BACT|nr:MAG: hypothetical protein A2928_03020 [Candidatus Taylorbacteria bacterium RIFCSPLOWO2_01_FULL_45_15b]
MDFNTICLPRAELEKLTQLSCPAELSRNFVEIERKYEFGNQSFEDVERLMTARLKDADAKILVDKTVSYAGVEWLIFHDVTRTVVRYRIGGKDHGKFCLKYPHSKSVEFGQQDCRHEIAFCTEPNPDVAVRIFRHLKNCLVEARSCSVINSGKIMSFSAEGEEHELVIYTIERFQDTKISTFVEIEVSSPNANDATHTLNTLERNLGIRGNLCIQSVADMFCV